MEKQTHSRRRFLKMSAAGTAGAVIGGMSVKKTCAGPTAWEDGMQINPQIDNLRVVYCKDSTMVKSNPVAWEVQPQNEALDTEKVHENMDKMAQALAQKATAGEAWETIFQKPEGKEWNQVMVAIKINAMTINTVRLAVIQKVCLALQGLGVDMNNVLVYDAGEVTKGMTNHIPEYQSDYSKGILPQGVKVEDIPGGELGTTVLPSQETVDCVKPLADGTADILVNIALNKGQCCGDLVGKFTMTVKNHIGSIRFQHYSTMQENIDYFENMVKSSAILGDGAPPRQQLCIVDSLWAAMTGPHGPPDRAPHTLVMGTFSPIVDYLTVKKIRIEEMEVTDTGEAVHNSLVTNFGYTLDDINEAEHWVDALAYEPPASLEKRSRWTETGNLILVVTCSSFRPAFISFPLQDSVTVPQVSISTLDGRVVRTFSPSQFKRNNTSIEWDGKSGSGATVRPGTYIVRLNIGKAVLSRRLVLVMQH